MASHRAILVDDQVWTVREVTLPSAAAALAERKGAATNWLSLTSYVEKRRIAPIPPGWQEWSDDELAEAVQRAEVMVARLG
jgi:hypothetical protein